VHLEVESFYQFAKILLDRVADAIYLYFGAPRPKFGSSHSKLVTKHFTPLCAALALDGQTVKTVMTDQHTRIVRHETDVIEHLANPKLIPGTFFGADGRARISTGMLAPQPGEDAFPSTGDPAVLFEAIETYIEAVVDFLERHRDQSVLVRTAREQTGGTMTRRWPCILFVLCCLPALVASASAECAWVLWEKVQRQEWDPKDAFPEADACKKDLRDQLRKLTTRYPGSDELGDAVLLRADRETLLVSYRCLPDSMDPRGPKEAK